MPRTVKTPAALDPIIIRNIGLHSIRRRAKRPRHTHTTNAALSKGGSFRKRADIFRSVPWNACRSCRSATTTAFLHPLDGKRNSPQYKTKVKRKVPIYILARDSEKRKEAPPVAPHFKQSVCARGGPGDHNKQNPYMGDLATESRPQVGEGNRFPRRKRQATYSRKSLQGGKAKNST